MSKNHIMKRMTDLEIIKKRISQELKNSGFSQSELGRKLNVSQSCIAHYIRGDILPSIEMITKICKLLELDANYLLGLEDESGRKTYINNSFNNISNFNNSGNISFQ